MNAQEGMEAEVDDSIRAEAVKGDTIVGNDVWIGYQAVILPGVRIGNGSIIASKAVASRDVPLYAIVAGNPARCEDAL